MLWSFLIVNLIDEEPDTIDYVFVYWLLGQWREKVKNTKKTIKTIIGSGHRDVFDLELDFTSKNLKDLGVDKILSTPLEVSYHTSKSKSIDKLVDKQFKQIEKNVSGQILNVLNTGDINSLKETLESIAGKTNMTGSIVPNLMRIYRTENTLMRSKTKLQIQQDLAKHGVRVRRRWMHTLSNPSNVISPSYAPREDHISMNGQIEDNGGYFSSPSGVKTKAPCMFGIAKEDINCRCDVDFVLE